MRSRLLALALCLCTLLSLIPPVSAQEGNAEDITESTTFSGTGYDSYKFLHDGNVTTYKRSAGNASITLENEAGIGSLYLMFDMEYGGYTITDNTSGETLTAGSQGFLHEYVDLSPLGSPTTVTLSFDDGPVRLSEIYVFSPGEPPNFVQRWDEPLEGETDLVLFAAQAGDDQLYYAGLLPLYAVEKDCVVQVVYLTDHRSETNVRTHEALNGLWSVGVTSYPAFGSFDELQTSSLEEAYNSYAYRGHSQDELLEFVMEQLRRFKPLVAVGPDLAGEKGNGMNMAFADLLTRAVELSGDPEAFPEQAARYGVWDVPKTYLHLYGENKIQIDYDQPLEAFDGMTAFQVSQQLGYPCHKARRYTWTTNWINGKSTPITQATQIETYSPCQFGLYRSTVGEDVQKDDFFENIHTYAEQERLEQERLEQERLELERLEQERLEQERLEQERLEQEQLEQERLEKERQERSEQQRLEQEQAEQEESQDILMLCSILLAALIALLILTVCVLLKHRKRSHKK